jgi:hypothetical protein
MKKVLFVFDEDKLDLFAASEIKKMFSPEETEVTAVSYNNDFYCYARSDYEKDRREASIRNGFDMIKSELKDYNVKEERVINFSADNDVLSLAAKKDADAIIVVGNTRKMRKMAQRINKKSNIAVTLIPLSEENAA